MEPSALAVNLRTLTADLEQDYKNLPWKVSLPRKSGHGIDIYAPQPTTHNPLHSMSKMVCMLGYYRPSTALAMYLAAVNPVNMTTLLDRIDELEAENTQLKAASNKGRLYD